MFDKKQKKYLVDLARGAVGIYFENEDEKEIVAKLSVPPDPLLAKKGASFVTLTIDGRLRGCIGSVEAHRPLFEDVASNAIHAAFFDPRFEPLSPEEFNIVAIEVSVLTEPKPLAYAGAGDLLTKLRPGVDGVILGRGARRATFLPQVWEELPKKEAFLGHLCAKAGLASDCWQKSGIEISVYQVE
jgi:AmmeMemoRadiSam system protein A